MESTEYIAEAIQLAAGDKVMIVSDGIIEQFGIVPGTANAVLREQFQMAGMQAAMSHATADEVADLFAAVVKHAGTSQLSDDATAVLVKWE
jgi:serine phosphatase RsbU (regulator of sigma subunit)